MLAATVMAAVLPSAFAPAAESTPKKGKWRGKTRATNPMTGRRGKIVFHVVGGDNVRRVRNPRVWGIYVKCDDGSAYTFKASVTRDLPITDGKWHLQESLVPDSTIEKGTLKLRGTFTGVKKGVGRIRVNFKTRGSKYCASGPLPFDKGYLSPG